MGDSFFVNPSNSRKRTRGKAPRDNDSDPSANRSRSKRPASRAGPSADDENDEDITSNSDMDIDSDAQVDDDYASSESDHETEADKRRRLAKEYLASLETELVEGFDAKDLDEDIIARRLKTDAAEQQGHIFRDLKHAAVGEVRKTRTATSPAKQSKLTAVACSKSHCYAGSKDGVLSKWTIFGSSRKPVYVRHAKISPAAASPTTPGRRESAALCICVNTANKLVVTGHRGGFVVHNAETLEPIREFRLQGEVLSCVFRRNTNELYVGGSDLRLRTYDLTQWAFVETLHGHQDSILDISALNQERCVSVGARDRTAIFWKIPEESRLTFRGGDTKLAAKLANIPPAAAAAQLGDAATADAADPAAATIDQDEAERHRQLQQEARDTILEGSIDCCAMLDHQLFVTGSDNGNLCLWSTGRKKPQFLQRNAHGLDPLLPADRASAETDHTRAEIPPQLPRAVTAVAAVPFSNTFFTGSWNGNVNMWTLSEDKRSFEHVREIAIGKGIVTSLAIAELQAEFSVVASLSREPRLGRWLVRPGHDVISSFSISI